VPAEDLAPADTGVRYYTYCWRIARYHDVPKRGYHIEDLQLETFDHLDRALAVYRIGAWRLLGWTYLAREQWESPCTTVLRLAEWAA